MLLRLPVLLFMLLFTTAKVKAQQLELVSSSKYYAGNFLPVLSLQDSINYIHSNGRNSNGYTGTWIYDSCEKYVPHQPGYVSDVYQRWVQKFDSDGYITDRTYYSYVDENMTLKFRQRVSYSYMSIAGKKLLSVETSYYDYNWPLLKYYYYDNVGRYTHSLSGHTGSTGNLELSASDSVWYDGNGNIYRTAFWGGSDINSDWTKRSGNTYLYDSENRMVIDSPYSATPYKAYTTYAYNAKGILAETQYYSTDDTGAWFKGTRELYTYDKHDNLVKIDGMGKDPQSISYYSFYETWFQYNGFNQLTQKLYVLHPPGAPRNESSLERYYYGKYLPLTIKSPESNTTLSLYPSPTVSNITVEATLKTADAFTAYITDMNGRIVKQWQDAGTRQYRKQINVMDLPAGAYSLTLSAGSEKQQKTFVVVR